MANENWEISIQVMEETLNQQVDQNHEMITVDQVVQPLVSTTETITPYELVSIERVSEEHSEEIDSICGVKIKDWQNLSGLCRLCAQVSSEIVQIFGDEGQRLKLDEIIAACLPIELCKDDALPQVACRPCVAAVQQSHLLLTTVKEADKNLRKILSVQTLQTKNLDIDAQEGDTESSNKPICHVCKQHFNSPDEVQPHIITIETEIPTRQLKAEEVQEINFVEPENSEIVDTKFFQHCTTEVILPDEIDGHFSRPKRKYNTRRVEEVPVLIESKLRPRKKGKVVTKRSPPKERLPPQLIQCNQCSGVFHKKDQYCKHYLLQHKTYLCPDCEQCFDRHEDLAAHSLEDHNSVIPPERYHHPPGEPPVCTFCTKEFKSISGLCHHVDSLHLKIPGNFLCNQCGKPFYGKKKLELHMMRHTGIKTVMCQDCGKMFYNESTLKIHSEMHSVQRKYVCSNSECDKTFKHWRNLYAHMHTVHGRKWNYACNACPLSFKTSEEALEHYEQHTEEERQMNEEETPFTQMSPFECAICFKHYNSQLHYSNHMKIHENPATSDANARNYECPTCCKRFKSKHYLKIHMGVHMTMKPFCCQYCGKSFITKMLLQTHERIHTNETPFRCEICGKGFRAQKKLQIHKRDVHDKIKNFVCLTCGKAFSRKNHLDAHIRTHTNERPYQCDVCGQGFKQVGDMRRHVARHQSHPQPLYKPQPHYKPPFKHQEPM